MPVDVPPGCSFLHVCIADRKAGDCLIPEGNGASGSGKLGTPCERMQFANSSASPVPAQVELPGPLAAAQPETAIAQPTAVSAIESRLQWRLIVELVGWRPREP